MSKSHQTKNPDNQCSPIFPTGGPFGDFEFLILDDGSRDATARIIRSHAGEDSRIRPIIRENRGLIVSLNQLITEARAPFVARMDADDICLPARLERQIAFLASHPDYGVVGCLTEDIDEAGAPLPHAFRDHPLTHAEFLAAIEERAPLLCHPSVMFRRDVVLSAGGYRAAFRHCEDLDLWLRLATLTQLGNVPERLIRYRHSETQVSSRHATEQQTGAAIARLAYQERKAGRPDPTAQLSVLPPLDELDGLFGRDGVAAQVREMVVLDLRYSRDGMKDRGFDLLIDHVRKGGTRSGMWRTVARLATFGLPARALRLAVALAATAMTVVVAEAMPAHPIEESR
jgi:hypothetical protein